LAFALGAQVESTTGLFFVTVFTLLPSVCFTRSEKELSAEVCKKRRRLNIRNQILFNKGGEAIAFRKAAQKKI